MAERRAENEVEDKPSIADLLDREGLIKEQQVKSEEKKGETTSEVNANKEDIVKGEE